MQLPFTLFEKLGIAALIAFMAAICSRWFVNKMPDPSETEKEVALDPQLIRGLEKAQKHLKRAKAYSSGEMHYQTTPLLEQVEEMNQQIQQNVQTRFSHREFHVVENAFAYLQIITACMMAFAHGANDVANAIGPLAAVISLARNAAAPLESQVPTWLLALGGFGIVCGLATWGWRVIETIGKKITELTPSRGFAAEFGASLTILGASAAGLPVSTTHTLVGAVLGVGLARGIGAINLLMIRDIGLSWLVTVPGGALLSIVIFLGLNYLF